MLLHEGPPLQHRHASLPSSAGETELAPPTDVAVPDREIPAILECASYQCKRQIERDPMVKFVECSGAQHPWLLFSDIIAIPDFLDCSSGAVAMLCTFFPYSITTLSTTSNFLALYHTGSPWRSLPLDDGHISLRCLAASLVYLQHCS